MANFEELSRVVMEANAFNKYLDNHEKQYRDLQEKSEKYKSLADIHVGKTKERMKNRADELDAVANCAHNIGSRYTASDLNKKKKENNQSKGSTKDDNSYASIKKRWMRLHGNEGQSPEEKYTKDRYLKTQEILKDTKESVDELKLEIYESCEYGEITKEQRDLLLANLD